MRKNGFTLLEVMVAVVILGFIMVLVQGTTSQLLDAKDRIESRDRALQMSRGTLDKIASDVSLAFLLRSSAMPEGTPGLTPEAIPTATTRPKLVTFFIGEEHGDRDSLRFTTLAHRRLYRSSHDSDQARVAYQVEASVDDPSQMNLVRIELPWLGDTASVEGKALTVAEGIRSFNLEYYDVRTDEWKKEWNTELVDWSGRIPEAIRVTIAFPDPEVPDDPARDIVFQTSVRPYLASGPLSP
ncbi:MAG: prepilin-type N-terminal cleavage/methylation domain-containing protein [Deltaproteobacteria bacterium]|nr:prepilin-type N-terminal cleavage/methylation domain-containing protein [Deltaproteobacteria bacterium]